MVARKSTIVSAPTPRKSETTRGALGGADGPAELSNAQLIRRMLGLAWGYRAGAIKVVVLQFVLLAMALTGLGLIGLGIDAIAYGFDPVSELNPDGAKAPRWPLGVSPPAGMDAMGQVLLVAGLIVVIGAVRFVFDRWSVVSVAVLVQDIVVDLRGKVYDKLQRLSFRFFDANESGSIINRVTGDVQMVRMFVDRVLIQVLMLLISLLFFAAFMMSLHVTLTLVCLATTPIIWGLTAYFSKLVKPAYRENRRLFDRAVRVLSENVQGVHVVKGFARQQLEQAEIRRGQRCRGGPEVVDFLACLDVHPGHPARLGFQHLHLADRRRMGLHQRSNIYLRDAGGVLRAAAAVFVADRQHRADRQRGAGFVDRCPACL